MLIIVEMFVITTICLCGLVFIIFAFNTGALDKTFRLINKLE
jgi:hypothetical protein